MEKNKIILGDCLEKLKDLEDNSIDAIVTDPPYGINFMGKKWDYDVPKPEVWKEVLRVLKPGGHALVACGTRTQHRMAVNLEDAGFEIRDIVSWIYSSGFPKSLNIKKTIEKKYLCQFTKNVRPVGKESRLTQAESKEEKTDSVAVYVGINQEGEKESLMVTGKVEDLQGQTVMFQFVSTEEIDLNTLLSLKKKLGENLEKENKHITLTELKTIIDLKIWKLLQYQNTLKSITTTNHTALKPSMELWTLCRKPLSEKNVASNCLKWGTGGINIDECRVETADKYSYPNGAGGNSFSVGKEPNNKRTEPVESNFLGRFPANLIHDGSEEVVSGFPNDSQRFFYTPKASRRERNEGLEGFEEKSKVFNGQSTEPSKDMKGVEQKFTTQPAKNNHPTVKPVKLMQYLCRLITPKNGTILDPYMGSGSTGIACVKEGFSFIGIEMDEEYCKIAEARINYQKKQSLN